MDHEDVEYYPIDSHIPVPPGVECETDDDEPLPLTFFQSLIEIFSN